MAADALGLVVPAAVTGLTHLPDGGPKLPQVTSLLGDTDPMQVQSGVRGRAVLQRLGSQTARHALNSAGRRP
jgi:hypothetical protein